MDLVFKRWALLLILAQCFLITGCTSTLWNKETFAQHYRPANPVNLHLFYSKERKDILVQYDETSDPDSEKHSRCYWLEPNRLRVNEERKPRFVSEKATRNLVPIAVNEIATNSAQPGFTDLYAVARHDDNFFTLYLGNEPRDPEKLPTYAGSSQRVKQVLLTPAAMGVDATVFGAVAAYFSAPAFFSSLNR